MDKENFNYSTFDYYNFFSDLKGAEKEFKYSFKTAPTAETVERVFDFFEQERYDYEAWSEANEISDYRYYKPSAPIDTPLSKQLEHIFTSWHIGSLMEWEKKHNTKMALAEGKRLRSDGFSYVRSEWEATVGKAMGVCGVSAWGLEKTIYKFDKDLLDVFANAKNILLPYNTIEHLQNETMFFDFTSNVELCEKLRIQGVYITVAEMYLNDEPQDGGGWWRIEYVGYPYMRFVGSVVINEGEFDNCEESRECSLIIQCLEYLASIDADIRPSRRSLKERLSPSSTTVNKAIIKLIDQTQEFEVGYRYGEAYRAFVEKFGESVENKFIDSIAAPSVYWCKREQTAVRSQWVSPFYMGTNVNATELAALAYNIIRKDDANGSDLAEREAESGEA